MVEFHKNLKAGHSKSSALRKAKLDYLGSASPRLSPPYFWATFIGLGNMEAMKPVSGQFNYWFLVFGLLMLLIVAGYALRAFSH